jgi:hypothetical protein
MLTLLIWTAWSGHSPHTLSISNENGPVNLTLVLGPFIGEASVKMKGRLPIRHLPSAAYRIRRLPKYYRG